MILTCLLLSIIGPLIFHLMTRYNKRGRLLSKIPGPTAYPLLGNMLKFKVDNLQDLWRLGREVSNDYYPITRFWICKTAIISVRHPDDLEVIFQSHKVIDKGYIYEYLHPWLKTGLLTSTGKKWRQRRKILTPAFHFSILHKYLEIANDQGVRFMNELKNESSDTIIVDDLMLFCSQYTLNIVCESAMGVKLDKMDGKLVRRYKNAVRDMGNVVVWRMPRPYITNWLMRFARKMAKVQRDALDVLHHFTDAVIQERRQYHEGSDGKYLEEFAKDCPVSEQDGTRRKLAMLDLLLAAERKGLIDHEGIKEEVDTFTFEAHDTTGMAMTFTLMLLAENKEAQTKARAEVTQVVEKYNGNLNTSSLQELPYLERCIKESLRLFPPVATLLRYTSDELQLKNALVPADSHIMIHLYDTHRDANYWPNPDVFDPDRFLPERSANRHTFAYVPFSAGPRNCIGQKLAMLKLKSLIGRILYDFYLENIDKTSDIKLTADVILRPSEAVKMKLVKIDKR
ncbi:cytochrome P450 4C1-like [Trichogramma pretiosum]|uniref:cytochrome P450 4C1-like n=1 Tax=Trichogramma pretiosum TaxID=7493 RepID=UPI000C71A800|nr:cytochrome P450 4C1-like [Trichogramma pretiosum]